jgi:hypothetical protein
MAWYLTKLVVTAVLIVLISEVSKRSSLIGAILASVPLVSVLAMFWLYVDTRDVVKISSLSSNIFWLVLPSLSLFILLPILLNKGMGFYLSMGSSLAVMIACYFVMVFVLQRYGITL